MGDKVYLGVGSNLGNREEQIEQSLGRLEAIGAITLVRMSSLYETEPVGWDGGPWYLNAVAEVRTTLSAETLLRVMKETERWAGRLPSERNAPRPVDLDLLLYSDEQIRTAELTVPHPRMLERAFVLWPLAEIAPQVEVAPGLTAGEAARRLRNHETIRLWKPSDR